ncbi:MAG TPA: ElyC/SanA/YdcF family protein [Propionicimonas sp.]|nr:ElyC/SanA/YdcF family protein [Propionicimonas sp.]
MAIPTIAARLGGLAALGAVGVVALGVGIRLATRERIVPIDRLERLPIGLVLGAEVYADGVPSNFLRARLDLALELYERGLVARILLSGDGRSRFYDETGGMRSYLVERGVPESVLLVDPAGLDTYDSCLRARDVYDVERLVVVSQSYHLPRALAICRALGLDAWGVGDDSMRSSPRTWANGARRELAANLKLVWDLLSHRPPSSGTHRL